MNEMFIKSVSILDPKDLKFKAVLLAYIKQKVSKESIKEINLHAVCISDYLNMQVVTSLFYLLKEQLMSEEPWR